MELLDRSRIIAKPGWSRWLVPPAALAIHLSIGQVYAWSVFKTPLEKSLHISGLASALPFQLGIFVLGLSAAFGGTFVERKGPRWAMLVATVTFSAGFLLSSLGMFIGQYWLVVVGYGVVGGIGLGIGYIAPVSTLMKWFPDRPGMATGIAIMGFGGGALIASPWSSQMLSMFGKTAEGIGSTFLVHGVVYAIFMSLGVALVRLPAAGWKPAGWNPDAAVSKPLTTTASVSASNALKTPQFWLLWIVLCLNVTAGIGVLEKAQPMIVDYFRASSTPVSVAAASGFVALLSFANMLGRFVWSTVSDTVGRKNMYRVYLGVGVLVYLALRFSATSSVALFVCAAMLIISFYGGGFSTIPAYLKDLFGTYQVGAIHGRLLTAWSVAGVFGPAIVNAIADSAKQSGKSGADLYGTSFYIMIGLLVVGFVANELIRPVDPKFHEPDSREPGSTESSVAPARPEATTDKVSDGEPSETATAAEDQSPATATPAETGAAQSAEGEATAGTDKDAGEIAESGDHTVKSSDEAKSSDKAKPADEDESKTSEDKPANEKAEDALR